MAKAETIPMTEPGSHVATQRGYAEGRIIEAGEAVPHGIAVADEWMVAASDAPAAEEEAPTE